MEFALSVKHLLEKYTQNEDPESDLFKTIVWLTEENQNFGNFDIDIEIEEIVSKQRKVSFVAKKIEHVTANGGFKKSVLGDVNICANGETWPKSDDIFLNPVIQLAVSDLPYIPEELEGIKYYEFR